MTVLITGASGFVGQALAQHLASRDVPVRAASRSAVPGQLPMPALAGDADWRELVSGCESVVHLAARVHRGSRPGEADPLFAAENVAATVTLARQAAAAGAGRFVFLSSVKVHGDCSPPDRPFTEAAPFAPTDAYGRSKAEAELGLMQLGAETGMEIVIIRPPLVHGPGVKANLLRLLKLVDRGVPLPLGQVHNARSLVGLSNLCDFIALCLTHPDAAGEAFLVSDAADLSTAGLIRLMGQALGRRPALLPVPQAWLQAGLRLAGREGLATRLLGDLQVDIGKARSRLGWQPVTTPAEEMGRTVARLRADLR